MNADIRQLFAKVTEVVTIEREPIMVGGDEIFVVDEGAVEIFLVDDAVDNSFVRRTFLFEAKENGPILGLHTTQSNHVRIEPVVPTTLLRGSIDDCWKVLSDNPSLFAEQGRNWAQGLSETFLSSSLPVLAHQLPASGDVEVKNKGAYYTEKPCWIEVREGALQSELYGPINSDSEWALLVGGQWFSAEAGSQITVHEFAEALGRPATRLAIRSFYRQIINLVADRKAQNERLDKERIESRAEVDGNILRAGWSRLGQVIAPPEHHKRAQESQDALLAACQLVGRKMGAPMTCPERLTGANPIEDIARASGLRVRSVDLEEGWWKLDSGPIVAWTKAENKPVALIPPRPGQYEIVDPDKHSRKRVDAEVAAELKSIGSVFQPRLPDHPVGLKELFLLALKNSRMDLVVLLLLGAGSGLLSLAVPMATKFFFDEILPSGNMSQLKALLLALLLVAGTNICFALSQSVALVRFGGRFGSLIANVMFDRLLTLHMPFYRKYAMGDLAQRALGVTRVRELVTGGTLSKIVSSTFALFSFVLLLYYDAKLAVLASLLLLLNLAFLTHNGFEQLKAQRRAADLSGDVNGVLYQILDALPKIRVAGAESRFFTYWSGRFSEQLQSEYRSGNLSVAQGVFTATFPVISTLILFAYVGYAHAPMETGTLLAFLAAFAQCSAGIAGLSESALEVSEALPQLERTRPILAAKPEVDEQKLDPGLLEGNLDLSNVVFRYISDQPPVLNGITLSIKPREFVALVGGTGAGKSTVLNMLLGFDQPESGAVFYDGKDLQTLDVQSVRQQLGVVLQDGRIVKDTVFRNLATGRPITEEQAWDALQMVGLQEDIEAMTDGLNTMISEKTFSGGQAQRLLIARAIVTRPRIIFFDEATSALDNKTQAVVSRSLDELNATRVVVAHRLSTIRGADRIFVFEKGRVAQTGTFEELAAQEGLFKELIGRQQA